MDFTSPSSESPNGGKVLSVASADSEDWSDFSSASASPSSSPQSQASPEQINIQALKHFHQLLVAYRSQKERDPRLLQDVTLQFNSLNESTRDPVRRKIKVIFEKQFPHYNDDELEEEVDKIGSNLLFEINGTVVMERALEETINFFLGEQNFMEYMEKICGEPKENVLVVKRRLDYVESSDESDSDQ